MTSASDIEHRAASWLVRHEAPDRTAGEVAAFEAWLNADPRNQAAYLRLKASWQRADALRRLRPLDGGVDENLLERVLTGASQSRRPPWRGFLKMTVALAGAVGLAAVGALTWKTNAQPEWRVYRTELGGFERVMLADESVVYLNTNSAMRVRYLDNRREVVLERGEAMFNVGHDARRPFYVQAGGTRLRAIGTAFSVRLHDPTQVEVLVTEGRIAIAQTPHMPENVPPLATASPTLSAGETVTIDANRVHVEKIAADEVRQRLGWVNGRVWFERQTLADVVGEFNRYNRDQLIVVDPGIAMLQLGGAFDAADIDSFVAALTRTFGIHATVTTSDGARTIVLTGPDYQAP